MEKICLVMIALALCFAAPTSTSFSCQFSMKTPAIANGVMTGKIHYSLSTKLSLVEFTMDMSPKELMNGTANSMSGWTTQSCERIEKSFVTLPATSKVAVACEVPNANCKRYYNGGAYVELTGTTLTAITFGDGRIYTLSSCLDFQLNATTIKTLYEEMKSKGCAATQCTLSADVFYVLDSSGSITSSQFVTLRDAVVNSLGGFDQSVDSVTVSFSRYSHVFEYPLNFSRDPVSTKSIAEGLTRWDDVKNRQTHTGQALLNLLTEIEGKTTNYHQIVILLTDGEANNVGSPCPSGYTARNCIGYAYEQYKAKFGSHFLPYAVGVADANTDELKKWVNNDTTRYAVGEWTKLSTMFTNMWKLICLDFSTTTPCQNCLGYCAAGGVCVCPTSCEYAIPAGSCGKVSCSSSDAKKQCLPVVVTCQVSDCYPTSTCSDGLCIFGSPCTQYGNHECMKSVRCNVGSPVMGAICLSDIACAPSAKCVLSSCNGDVKNITSTCVEKPVVCLDGNALTTSSCSLTDGLCHHVPCKAPGYGFRLIENYIEKPTEKEDIDGLGCVYEKIVCPKSTACAKVVYNDSTKSCDVIYRDCGVGLQSRVDSSCYFMSCDERELTETEVLNVDGWDGFDVCKEIDISCQTGIVCASCVLPVNNKCVLSAQCKVDGDDATCETMSRSIPVGRCFNASCNPLTGDIEYVMNPLENRQTCIICDEATGNIVETCVSTPCNIKKCVNGICSVEGNPCAKFALSSPCNEAYCDNGRCVEYSLCVGMNLNETGKCYDVKCNAGDRTCYKEAIVGYCVTVPCVESSTCNFATGLCDVVTKECTSDDKCEKYKCISDTGNCEIEVNKHLLDGDVLEDNACFQQFGNDYCVLPSCDASSGNCVATYINCIPEKVSPCYEYFCNGAKKNNNCEKKLKEDMVDDNCGGCVEYPGNECAAIPIPIEGGIGIAVGVAIAVAVLVALVVLLALFLLGGKKTYDMVKRSKTASMTGATESPIYEESQSDFVSAAYEA